MQKQLDLNTHEIKKHPEVSGLRESVQYKYCSRCKQRRHVSEFSKNRSKEDGLQTECKACKRIMRAKDPNHDRARSAVRQAVLAGELQHVSTQDCVKCGKQAQEWHHTKGYAPKNWLDVEPICRSCHRKLERALQSNSFKSTQQNLPFSRFTKK
ncbi:hypothetical protein KC799_11015 [candidate division KSB1 bacterium]|nr:hypothetical protein [candidate division KSB1 bacterium]